MFFAVGRSGFDFLEEPHTQTFKVDDSQLPCLTFNNKDNVEVKLASLRIMSLVRS